MFFSRTLGICPSPRVRRESPTRAPRNNWRNYQVPRVAVTRRRSSSRSSPERTGLFVCRFTHCCGCVSHFLQFATARLLPFWGPRARVVVPFLEKYEARGGQIRLHHHLDRVEHGVRDAAAVQTSLLRLLCHRVKMLRTAAFVLTSNSIIGKDVSLMRIVALLCTCSSNTPSPTPFTTVLSHPTKTPIDATGASLSSRARGGISAIV